MPTSAKQARAQAQAIYLKELYEQAKIIYKQNQDELPVDPQGRVLLEVTLNLTAWENLYRAHNALSADGLIPSDFNIMMFKHQFTQLLGHPISETTWVSYDRQTANQAALDPPFKAKLGAYLPQKNSDELLQHYQNLAKGRIISLQQETHFHAHLIGRMLREAIKRSNKIESLGSIDALFQQGINQALITLNEHVMKLQAEALKKAFKKANKDSFSERIFKKELNKGLDSARARILPEIAKTVRIALIKSTGIQFDHEITQHLSRHLAEETSASSYDLVHSNSGLGLISYLGASTKTSHHRCLGHEQMADRIMYSHYVTEKGEVQALVQRQQIRVPSLAVKKLHKSVEHLLDDDEKRKVRQAQAKKKGLNAPALPDDLEQRVQDIAKNKRITLSRSELDEIKDQYTQIQGVLASGESREHAFNTVIIADTAAKIKQLQDKYQLGVFEKNQEIPKAFVYNLYTSINRSYHPLERFDESRNQQTQSAQHILEAAHAYNRANPDKPRCLVQNIPINGWGYEVSIKESNPIVVNEAALMAQLASLHTVYEALPEEAQNNVQYIFARYDKFLNEAKPGDSFYQYIQENRLDTFVRLQKIRDLILIKPILNEEITLESHRASLMTQARYALARLLKEQAFSQHAHGFTYQALSVFLEQASISGCKSANERSQAVYGRVSMLDFVSFDQQTRNQLLEKYLSKQEAKRLKKVADDLESAIKAGDLATITNTMNVLYGSLNLEGFQALISFIDQGGHAKLGTKGKIPNTNDCETIQTDVKNASKWQCHKGLTDYVLEEFCGIKKFSWGKEIAHVLKAVVGAMAAGALSYGVALGIAAAVGMTAGFPPVGLVLGIAAAVGLVAYTLCKVVPKWWGSREAKAQERFQAIQKENEQLIQNKTVMLDSARQTHRLNRKAPVNKIGDPQISEEELTQQELSRGSFGYFKPKRNALNPAIEPDECDDNLDQGNQHTL